MGGSEPASNSRTGENPVPTVIVRMEEESIAAIGPSHRAIPANDEFSGAICPKREVVFLMLTENRSCQEKDEVTENDRNERTQTAEQKEKVHDLHDRFDGYYDCSGGSPDDARDPASFDAGIPQV